MTARIEQVELARYVGPGRALARPHGLVVRLRTGAATGVGEAVVAGDQTEPAWRELREIAPRVRGATLPGRGDPPLAGIRGWRQARAADRGPRRAAKLAVEMALLDLLRATGELPGWQVATAEWQPVHQLSHTSPAPAPAPEDRSWAVKLGLTGDPATDLDRLRQVTARERQAGRERPLWLVSPGLDPARAGEFVRELAAQMRGGALARTVLLEEPVARAPRSLLAKARERSALARFQRRSPLGELQRAADQALGKAEADGSRLLVLAGESVVSAAQAGALAGSVGGLQLSLSRFGSLLGMREAARAAKRANPAVLVVAAGDRGSRITTDALAALVAATPEIDRYAPEPPPPGWPELAGARLDLGELSMVADELASFPPAKAAATAEPPNTFPDYPLAGAALAVRSMLLETEALRAGLRTRRLARDFFLVEQPDSGETIGFFDSESSPTSVAGSAGAAHKGVSRELLAAQGLPVPPGGYFPASAQARAYAAGLELGFPLVVKPAGGSKGIAVTTGIGSEPELDRALDEVAGSRYGGTGIVVERFVTGDDYRVLATRDEVLSVVRREPAAVVGDGQRSVEELVLAANVARRRNPHLAKRLITIDDRVDEQLRRQQLTRRSVPAAGQRVRLRAEANLSLGGDSREVLESVHPSLRELAVAAVAAIPGLPYAGLDILLEDHRRPVDAQQATIIEVNSRPVQSLHHFPMFGPPRNVSARLVRDAAESAGWALRTSPDRLTVRLTATGRTRGVGYQRWLAGAARQLGLDGWIRAGRPQQVTALVHGPAPRVGLLVRLAFRGPAEAGIVETCAEPVDLAAPAGFTIHGTDRRP